MRLLDSLVRRLGCWLVYARLGHEAKNRLKPVPFDHLVHELVARRRHDALHTQPATTGYGMSVTYATYA